MIYGKEVTKLLDELKRLDAGDATDMSYRLTDLVMGGYNCRGGPPWPPQSELNAGVATEGHPYNRRNVFASSARTKAGNVR